MCRKLFSLVLVLGFVSAAYGEGVVISSWENPPELKGWSVRIQSDQSQRKPVESKENSS
jgi:hypothetical protein